MVIADLDTMFKIAVCCRVVVASLLLSLLGFNMHGCLLVLHSAPLDDLGFVAQLVH